MTSLPKTILCLSSGFKGEAFLECCKEEGCRVILITEEQFRHEAWPWAAIDEVYYMPDLSRHDDVLLGVSYLARTQVIDRVVALDDYDVRLASDLREHLRLPGMGSTTARFFRDKLSMRMKAEEAGLRVPAFVHVLNHDRLNQFMDRVPPPWVLKPRFEAGAVGIMKAYSKEEAWQNIHDLGDRQSFYLLEQFVSGDVYHVDALVDDREIVFMRAHKYGRPPLNVSHQGGVFISATLPFDSDETHQLHELNRQLINATGYVRGATHTEYIRGEDGHFYFLETAARVGGANLADMIAASSGVNLWREWARIEVAHVQNRPYVLPTVRDDYAGILICLSRQEWPDMSAYSDPEVVWRIHKPYHAGLIVASPSHERVQTLLAHYSNRFALDFLTVGPTKEATRTA
jgi:hypothetical protein